MSFGFSAESAAANAAAAANQAAIRRESHVPSVNVTPTSHDLATGLLLLLLITLLLKLGSVNVYINIP